MSTLLIATATGAVAFVAGWLSAAWTIHRLRRLLALALWTCGHDQLTGLPNRAHAEHLFGHRAAAGLPTTVALLDVDRFKQVNDSYGHHAGDQLLVAVAARLAKAAASYGGHAARLSGDEFILLLPIHPAGFLHPVDTILRELATPVEITTEEPVQLIPTATAGATRFDGDHGSWNSLLRQADLALYHARAHGLAYAPYRPGMRMPDQPPRFGPRLRDHRGASA